MAQRTEVLLLDDLEGSRGEEVHAKETITYSVGGQWYQIDLSTENAELFSDALAPWIRVSRKIPAPGTPARKHRSAASRARSAEIRAWAKSRGHEVSERGRIPASVVAEFEAQHG